MHAIVELHTVSHRSLRYVLGLADPGSQFGHLWYNVCSWVLFVLAEGLRVGWLEDHLFVETCSKSDGQL